MSGVKRLVLVGGGHTHALLLKMLSMKPIAGLELILVSPEGLTAYTGMLPSHIAGHFNYHDMHIDLRQIAKAAGASFYQDEVALINADRKELLFRQRPPLSFDLLSINVGSEPSPIPGDSLNVIGIKPVKYFMEHVLSLSPLAPIIIAGGGLGGIEIALNLRARGFSDISLVHSGAALLSQYSLALQSRIKAILLNKGIKLELSTRVERAEEGKAFLSNGKVLNFLGLYRATDARAPAWLAQSELAVDAKGFLKVDPYLRALGRSYIFAAGDCAGIEGLPRAKAGVFAVRAAKPLYRNIRRYVSAQSLKPIKLQKDHLLILTLGDKRAIAIRRGFSVEGNWVWAWKRKIDQKFMAKFQKLKAPMPLMKAEPMRCQGCGAKFEGSGLRAVIKSLQKAYPNTLPEGGAADDVAVIEVPHVSQLLQSLDFITAFIDDPYIFGRIAANHAANDIFAKGVSMQSALALANLPHKTQASGRSDLLQLMGGVLEQLSLSHSVLLGGHSSETTQLGLGLQVQAWVQGAWKRKQGLKAGDVLILTKPLGTGILFAGQHLAPADAIDSCLLELVQSQHSLAKIIRRDSVHGSTDITGFGLLGHLGEMAGGDRPLIALKPLSIPLYPAVGDLIARGVRSTLLEANIRYAHEQLHIAESFTPADLVYLCDPQTSGPILISVEAAHGESVLAAIRAEGFRHASIIGELQKNSGSQSRIVWQ